MVLFLLLQPLFADLVLTSEVINNNEKITSVSYLSEENFLVESPSRQSALLYLGKNDQFFIIDHKEKKLTMIYQKDLFIHAKKRAQKNSGIKDAKKNIPETYGADLEKSLGEVLKASDMSYQSIQLQVKESSDNRKWNKYETTKYDAIVEGKKTLSLWVLPYKLLKLSEEEMSSVILNAKLLRFFIASLGQETASTIELAYLKVLEKEKSLLVFAEQYGPNFKVEASSRLVDFKRAKSFATKFKPPSTYIQTNFVPK
jgi:hypothetical protein